MEYLVLIFLGFCCGTVGAMLGLGGSIVLIPTLNEAFGPRQHLHQAIAMIVSIFVVAAACWGHRKAGAIQGGIIKNTIPASIFTVLLGVWVSGLEVFQGANQEYLTGVFGAFLLIAGICYTGRLLRAGPSSLRDDEPIPSSGLSWKAVLLVGAPTGFVSGLLGLGGGIIAVPAQQLFLRIGVRDAIANSAATMLGLSVVGAAAKNYHWWAGHPDQRYAPVLIAIVIIPTAVLGGLVGSRLTHLLPPKWVSGCFLAVLLIAGVRQLSHAML